jgi:hypothetical protein
MTLALGLHTCAMVLFVKGDSMNRSLHYAWNKAIPCSICGNSVLLEVSKTDEQGSAVHEECYVGRTVALFAELRAEGLAQITRPLLQQEIGTVVVTLY